VFGLTKNLLAFADQGTGRCQVLIHRALMIVLFR